MSGEPVAVQSKVKESIQKKSDRYRNKLEILTRPLSISEAALQEFRQILNVMRLDLDGDRKFISAIIDSFHDFDSRYSGFNQAAVERFSKFLTTIEFVIVEKKTSELRDIFPELAKAKDLSLRLHSILDKAILETSDRDIVVLGVTFLLLTKPVVMHAYFNSAMSEHPAKFPRLLKFAHHYIVLTDGEFETYKRKAINLYETRSGEIYKTALTHLRQND